MKKNKLVYLLILLCLVFTAYDVKAYDEDTGFSLTNHGKTEIDGLSYNGIAHTNSIFSATSKVDTNEKYYIYCADPNISAYYDLKVDHILMGSESSTKAEDYGILNILNEGVWQYNGGLSGIEQHIDYEARSLAIRMFVNAVLGWNYRHTTKDIFPTYIGTAYTWINSDDEMKEAYLTLSGKSSTDYILRQFGYAVPAAYTFSFATGSNAERTGELAKSYLKKGLLAAVEYKKGNISMPEVEVLTAGGSEVTENGDIYERTLVASIKLKGFTVGGSDPGYFYYKGISDAISSASIQEVGYAFDREAAENATNGALSQSINLVELLDQNNTDTIYITYKVTLVSDGSVCLANFKINYEYGDVNLLNGAMLFPASHAGKDYTDGQRFLLYSDAPIENSHLINAKMCDSYCSPTVELPQICNDDVPESDIDDNGNVDYEFREGYKNGAYEIGKCILNNSDAANNPYKLTDGKYAGIVASNPYCTISCKEDYLFNVPYKRTVDNGRYFRISMSIKGQQDCYSSKIDYDKFKKDMVDAQKNVIDVYNKWMEYYELFNNPLINSTEKLLCYERDCSEIPVGEPDPVTGVQDTVCSSSGISEVFKGYKKEIKFRGIYYAYSENADGSLSVRPAYSSEKPKFDSSDSTAHKPFGETDYNEGTCPDSGSCTCRDSECEITKTPEEDYAERKAEYDAKLAEYEEKLKDAIEQLKQKVDLYNGCVGDKNYHGVSEKYTYAYWDMIYRFDPEISYTYQEPDPTDYSVEKWIDEVKALSCEDTQCNVMFGIDEKIYAEACDTDDDKCQNVNQVTTIFDKNTVNTTTYCNRLNGTMNEATYECSNPTTTPSYQEEEYFNCNFDEATGKFTCVKEKYNVTTESYIHKVATAEGTYDTPRVYYSLMPSGGIEISTSEIEDAYEVDGLPVGVSTPPGTYFYVLSVDNIGQYYSNQQLGRIFGHNTTSLTSAERLEREQTINDDELKGNEYACIYTVSQSCTDDAGVIHDVEECDPGEDWNTCKKRLCPNAGSYCVKEAEAFYVCQNQYYEEDSCTKYDTRDAAIAAADENYSCCPQCQMICIGNCIFDLGRYPDPGNLNLEFRPITPSIINPNNRPLGYNWDKNNPMNVLVAQKAGNTISEIEERANVDVETATPEQLAAIEEYTLKVTMTPAMANWIKEYNNDNEADGSYNNDTLTCYDFTLPDQSLFPDKQTCTKSGYSWVEDKCVMANAFCYSDFITQLDTLYDQEIDAPKRDLAINTAHNNYEVYTMLTSLPHQGTGLGDNNYQIHTVNDYWTVYTYTNLDINGDAIPDIGPAWK